MLLNSIQFLIFLAVVVILYFNIKQKYRWILLLIGSYYFYMSFNPEYAILLIIATLINYVAGLQIARTKIIAHKKLVLVLSLVGSVGILFFFKYFNFFSDTVRSIMSAYSIQLNPLTVKILLPIGISFYTFQAINYTLDVYWAKMKPEKHLGIFALYVAFFPQITSGPISRATSLLPQFYEKHYFEYKRVTDGLKLILWGVFKKMVIADRLAVVVNQVYGNVGNYTGIPLVLATIFFAFQIFCDFSGYTDMAIGSAQIMGFRLMDNFRRPYFAKSIAEFWRRWHISLSSWFRDYLYIPLGGNRVKVSRWYFNIFVTFLVSGLWHGASWTFVVWGALHGIYMVFSIATQKIRDKFNKFIGLTKSPKFHNLLKMAIVFVLVNISWIFFRASSFSDAAYILRNLFVSWSLNFKGISLGGIGINGVIIGIIAIIAMEIIHVIQERGKSHQFLDDRPIWFRWSLYLILIFAILLFGVFEATDFIYAQF